MSEGYQRFNAHIATANINIQSGGGTGRTAHAGSINRCGWRQNGAFDGVIASEMICALAGGEGRAAAPPRRSGGRFRVVSGADRPPVNGDARISGQNRTFANQHPATAIGMCSRYCPVLNLCHIRVMVRDCSLEVSVSTNNRFCSSRVG